MKIAIAIRNFKPMTGTCSILSEHIKGMAGAGHEVHLFAEKLDCAGVRALGGVPHRVYVPILSEFLKRRFYSWLTGKRIKSQHFDVVSGHGDTVDQDVLSLHNCVHATQEAMNSKQPTNSRVAKFHAEILLRRPFKSLIANSHLMKRDIVRRFAIPSEMVNVVYPAFDPHRFNLQAKAELRKDNRKELHLTDKNFCVGLVTSGDFRKRGVGIFLDVLQLLQSQFGNVVRGIVVGKGHDSAVYTKRAAEMGLASTVQFLTPAADIRTYFSAMDVMLYPAHFEEFGMVVQEAVAMGVPVVTNNQVGATELFQGLAKTNVLEKISAQHYAARVQDLMEDQVLRRQWVEDALRGIESNTWERNIAQTLAIFSNSSIRT